jgi:hypothetical protein
VELTTLRAGGTGLYGGPGADIAAAGGGAPGPLSDLMSVLERIRMLETRHNGNPVKIGMTTFANFEDVKAFVNLHIKDPYFGVFSDMVIILQKLKTEMEMATSLIVAHAGARKLNFLDVMEANIIIYIVLYVVAKHLGLFQGNLVIITCPCNSCGEEIHRVDKLVGWLEGKDFDGDHQQDYFYHQLDWSMQYDNDSTRSVHHHVG